MRVPDLVLFCASGERMGMRKGTRRRLKGNVSVDVQNQLESIKLTGIKYGSLKDYLS